MYREKLFGLPAKSSLLAALLAFCMVVFATYIAIKYRLQLPLEYYGFRQTQTALTSFWFMHDGFKFAYETPVGGAPWILPFEFPVYQYVVAIVAKLSGADLVGVGRVLSFVFLLGIIPAVSSICRSVGVSRPAFYAFTALLFSSPLYLLWGRSFMIETAALFFGIYAVKYFLKMLNVFSWKDALLYLAFIIVALLQKVTTALPIVVFLGGIYLTSELRKSGNFVRVLTFTNALMASLLFVVPVLIAAWWTNFTDDIKSSTLLGTQLSSPALVAWNWGTLAQRFSAPLYLDVVWQRIFVGNLGGGAGGLVLLVALLFGKSIRSRVVVSSALALGLLPLLLFSNLHIVHTYYQTSCAVFFIFALAVALMDVPLGKNAPMISVVTLFLLVAINLYVFWSGNYKFIVTKFDNATKDVAISRVLQSRTAQNQAFIAYGNDWDSSLAFLSQRKSFTIPHWFKEYDQVLQNPEKYLGDLGLGAVVVCPGKKTPSLHALLEFADRRNFIVSEVSGCYMATANRLTTPVAHRDNSSCEGSLDYAGPIPGGDKNFVFRGWTTISGIEGTLPDNVYITATDSIGNVRYFDTAPYFRIDVAEYFQNRTLGDAGFSRIVSQGALTNQVYGIARVVNGTLETCQFRK